MRKGLAALVFLFIAGGLFASPCNDAFIMISGISGELIGPGCGGGIDFMSARVAGNTLTLVKKLDKASPQLFMVCAGGHHTNATLTVPAQNMSYRFTDLMVTSVSQGASPANETVLLTFKGFESHTPGAPERGSAAARPRELNINGSAQSAAVTVTFVTGTAAPQVVSRWQTSIRRGSAPTASLQPLQGGIMQTPATAQSTLGCVELRSGGTLLARYVFQGVVPAQGGNLTIEKMQIQIPPGPNCNFLGAVEAWNLHSYTAN